MLDLALVLLPNPALSNPKMYYPLGVLYLSSIAKNIGRTVSIVDMRDKEYPIPLAKITGFSCTTPEIDKAKELAVKLKGTTKTVVGGAHPTLLPDDCTPYFDIVVRGEGEDVFRDILEKDNLTGIVTAGRISDLDDIPLPDWDAIENPFSKELFPGERYGQGELAATIITSRGCPYHCSFCGNALRTPVTYRTPESIEKEVVALLERGVRYYRFEDDNFTLNPDFQRICHMLTKYNVHYKCHTRANLLTLDKAIMMKESGCEECGLGVESADSIVLQLNTKGLTAEDDGRAVMLLRQAGIRSKTYMIAGLPGETEETLEINKKFFRMYKPDKWTLSTFTPYPGCAIWYHPERYGVEILNKDWSKWWNFAYSFNHRLITSTADELWSRYKRFYTYLRSEEWKK